MCRIGNYMSCFDFKKIYIYTSQNKGQDHILKQSPGSLDFAQPAQQIQLDQNKSLSAIKFPAVMVKGNLLSMLQLAEDNKELWLGHTENIEHKRRFPVEQRFSEAGKMWSPAQEKCGDLLRVSQSFGNLGNWQRREYSHRGSRSVLIYQRMTQSLKLCKINWTLKKTANITTI